MISGLATQAIHYHAGYSPQQERISPRDTDLGIGLDYRECDTVIDSIEEPHIDSETYAWKINKLKFTRDNLLVE